MALMLVLFMALFTSFQNLLGGDNYFWSNNRPYTYYNNFVIFRQSFLNLLHDKNLYAPHLDVYADLFKYSPAFALMMAPLQLLPVWAGLILWNLAGGLLIILGLKSIIPDKKIFLFLLVLLIPETFTSMSNSQSNNHIAGLLLLAFGSLEKDRPFNAAFFVMLTVFIKLFTLVFLPLLILYPRKEKTGVWLVVWFIVLGFSPALLTGLDTLLWQYSNWLEMLRNDHSISTGIGLQGLAEALGGVPLNKNLVLVFGALLLGLPLLNIRCFSQSTFRHLYFALTLLWMVLFNHKAESPTFIIVMCGVVLFAAALKFNTAAKFFLITCTVFTSLAVTDLVPHEIRKTVVQPYCLKALFPSLLMLYLVVLLLSYKPKQQISDTK